jgi:hypothetical protein
MNRLDLKKKTEFESGKTYSLCLRGARQYETNGNIHLELFGPDDGPEPKHKATIVSQKQRVFKDLVPYDFEDNYDESARSSNGLLKAMQNVYIDFDAKEIVTVLRFKIK